MIHVDSISQSQRDGLSKMTRRMEEKRTRCRSIDYNSSLHIHISTFTAHPNAVTYASNIHRSFQVTHTSVLENQVVWLMGFRVTVQSCCFSSASRDGLFVLWNITDRCNLACPHCHGRAKREALPHENARLRRAELRVVIDRLADVRPHSVAISGGEPLLFPDILWLLRELREHGLNPDVCTNGMAVTPELVRSMAEAVERVSVSLDSFSREKSATLKGSPEACDRALEAIDAFVAAGMQVNASIVPTGITYEEIVATTQGLAQRGVASISILPLMATRHTTYRLTPAAWRHLNDSLPSLIDVCQRYDVELKLKGFPLDEETMTRCGAGEHVVAISSRGHLWPCVFFGENSEETDLMKVTIPEALVSSSFEQFRRDIAQTACADCAYASLCEKGCVGVSWVERGVIAPDPRCARKTLRSTEAGAGATRQGP